MAVRDLAWAGVIVLAFLVKSRDDDAATAGGGMMILSCSGFTGIRGQTRQKMQGESGHI